MVCISAKFAYTLPWNLTQSTMQVRVADLGTPVGGGGREGIILSSIQHQHLDPIDLWPTFISNDLDYTNPGCLTMVSNKLKIMSFGMHIISRFCVWGSDNYAGWGEMPRSLVPWRARVLGISQGMSVWVGLSKSRDALVCDDSLSPSCK